MTLKEALDSGYCSLEDDIDFDDTPQGEKIACLKLEIERLNNIIKKLENYIRARADDNDTCSVCSVMADDLLNILKGSDKE